MHYYRKHHQQQKIGVCSQQVWPEISCKIKTVNIFSPRTYEHHIGQQAFIIKCFNYWIEELKSRKKNRLQGYDYSQNGSYFITICTKDRVNLFGNVVVGADSISARMELNHAGRMIEDIYLKTINTYNTVNSDIFVIMPNHFHCILSITRADIESAPTIADIIQSFKRNTTIKYINGVKADIYAPFSGKIWQRSFHDHIIRDEAEYKKIWQYIDENPARWPEDKYYVQHDLNG